MTASRYQNSIDFLKRAEAIIPLGSQTFSKSRTQYPVGVSPLFIDRAKGSYVWDLDGNRYIDLVNSLAAITLGYNNKYVNRAVARQLKKGTLFSLPGILETEVAERIVELVPSAEMVRFAKNGTDATSAAIRLARAYTGRDHVLFCGYHGWQDWFVGATTKNKGVPLAVSMLTHKFLYNDLESLTNLFSALPNQVAAVILEPMNSTYPNPGFLEGVRDLTQKNGSILIFDEVVTGFRFDIGGAQKLFDVTPDLTALGKGIANGYPLSAIVGKKEIMNEMENIFFSGTFGGELLSLASAKATIELYKKFDVCGELNFIGSTLAAGLRQIISELEMESILEVSGHPTWLFLLWKSAFGQPVENIKSFFLQEMFNSGVLVLSTHNVSLSLKTKDIDKVLVAYEMVLSKLKHSLISGTLPMNLRCEPVQNLFSIR
jgi:glutamate-1-semialdehyde aminotransferase